MSYIVRRLDGSSAEVHTAAAFSMLTILETLPESRREPGVVPNLDIASMARMYAEGQENPDHLYLFALSPEGEAAGHIIALLREDEDGVVHGYGYTLYVLPAHRRQGAARALLEHAMGWWRERGAAYVLAHTHPTNAELQALFASLGFSEVARGVKRWESITLRVDF